jgi:hypothetical protein
VTQLDLQGGAKYPPALGTLLDGDVDRIYFKGAENFLGPCFEDYAP